MAVHGQSDQLRLKSAVAQRKALDEYAGAPLAKELAAYREKLARYRIIVATLREIKENMRERALEAQSLTTALEEIDAVEPISGEDVQLDAESEKLTNLEALRSAAVTAQAALSGTDADDEPNTNAVALLSYAQQALDHESDSDAELAELATRVRAHGGRRRRRRGPFRVRERSRRGRSRAACTGGAAPQRTTDPYAQVRDHDRRGHRMGRHRPR